jgi:hypothetical protein
MRPRASASFQEKHRGQPGRGWDAAAALMRSSAPIIAARFADLPCLCFFARTVTQFFDMSVVRNASKPCLIAGPDAPT